MISYLKKLFSRAGGLFTGFTLLETIVALGVILAASVGPVSLVTRSLIDFSFSKNKLVAVNLAQEGIELIRGIRDNNIACDILNGTTIWPWNEDPQPPDPGNTITNTTVGVAVDRTITSTCGGIGGISMVMPILSLSCDDKLLFDTTTGIYGYSSGQASIFSRCVQIKTPPDTPDSDISPTDQMDITSTVRWVERGTTKNIVLKERLYNWR